MICTPRPVEPHREEFTLFGCGVGKVKKPKRDRPGNRFRLVVKRASESAGAIRPGGAMIGLTLRWKRSETRSS